ncbi:hypothetical protein JYU34_019067 [Plutella xylostella]|uniref:Major facilitator superfamily (MFS) profile domain-containing protein n=1 Tax=Plutella xylostella TaxID=51655 RepID=A0ABQ7PZ41_PLUXY|nr:hypothetical protein JYU34_019067 [Plutella xylostella]
MPPPVVKQVYASCGALCLFFTNGYLLGLQAVLAPSLRGGSLRLTPDQESWIPSSLILMVFPSEVLFGIVSDALGRRRVLLAALLPCLAAVALLHRAGSYPALLAAYCCAGVGGGGLFVASMTVAELTAPRYRPAFISCQLLTQITAIGLAHYISNFVDWRSQIIYVAIPCVLGMLATVTAPESPVWLAARGRFEEAKAAHYWLHGDDATDSLQQLIKNQQMEIHAQSQKIDKTWKCRLSFLKEKQFLRAMFLAFAAAIFIENCGKQLFNAYAIDMINMIMHDPEHVYYYAAMLDAVDVVSLALSIVVIQKFNRRTLLMSLGFPALALLFITSLFSFLLSKDIVPARFAWVTLLLLSVYFFMLNIGVIPSLYTVMNEVYPVDHRGAGAAATSLAYVSVMFVVTKLAPALLRGCGVGGVLAASAAVSALSLLGLCWRLPETGGRTLVDISEQLRARGARGPRETGLGLAGDVRDKFLKTPYPPSPTSLLNVEYVSVQQNCC